MTVKGRRPSILYRAEIGSSGWIADLRREGLRRRGCAERGHELVGAREYGIVAGCHTCSKGRQRTVTPNCLSLRSFVPDHLARTKPRPDALSSCSPKYSRSSSSVSISVIART